MNIVTQQKHQFTYKSDNGNGMINGNMDGIQDRLKKNTKQTDVYVDLGAHIGTMSIPVVMKCKPVKSIFVEANPKVIPLLVDNIKGNLPGLECEVLNLAICDVDAEVDFRVIEEKADSSSMNREGMDMIPPTRVQGMTLNTLLRDVPGEFSMKVDIETAEVLMWRAADQVAPRIREMVMEWFMSAMKVEQAKELLALIRQNNFMICDFNGKELDDDRLLSFGKEDLWLRNKNLI